MSIRMEYDTQAIRPVVLCDACNGRIDRATDGHVVWILPEAGSHYARPLFLHYCCDSQYRADRSNSRMPLEVFMCMLVNQIGQDPGEVAV